jgi:hypothetical protein
MGTCRDPDAFYDILGDACANPRSSECRGVIPRALAAHGSACLDLSYVRGNQAMPPLRPYVCERATGGLATQCGLSSRSSTGPGAGLSTGADSSTGAGASTGFAGSTVALTSLGALAIGAAGADIKRKLLEKVTPGVTGVAVSAAPTHTTASAVGTGIVGDGATVTAAADSDLQSVDDKHREAVRATKEMALCFTHPLECAEQEDIQPHADDPGLAALTDSQVASAWTQINEHRILVKKGDLTGDERKAAYDDLVAALNGIDRSIVDNVNRNVTETLGVRRLGDAQEALKIAYCTQFPLFCHGEGEDLTGYRHKGDHIRKKGPKGWRLLFEGRYNEAAALHAELKERHITSSTGSKADIDTRTGKMNAVADGFRNRMGFP